MLPILLLAFLLRIACLDAQSLWWDEAFSFSMSVADMPSLMENAIHYRVHPPLYYMLMHFWISLGHSEFLLRTLSVFCGTLSVAIIYATTALIGGKRLATLATLLLAVSPFNIWYSQEVRMYSLTALLVLMSSFFFLRLLRHDTLRNWIGFGSCASLAVYSDYLYLFIILAQAVFLIILRRTYPEILYKWFCCMVVVGILFLPWVVAIFVTGGFYHASISWIPPARIADLFWTIYSFGLGPTSNPGSALNITAALLLISLAVYGLLSLRDKPGHQQQNMGFVLFWLLLPLLLTFFISLDWHLPQQRSIYIDRFFNPLLPAFLILTSFGIFHLFRRSKVIGTVTFIIILIPTTSSLYNLFFNQDYARDQWRQAIAEITENGRSGDILLVRPHHYVPLYYYGPQEISWHTVPYLDSRQEYETFLDSEIPARLSEGGRLWTMIVCENANPHRFVQGAEQRLMEKVERDEVRSWLLQNYQLLKESVYNGMYLALYGHGQYVPPGQRQACGNFVPLTRKLRFSIMEYKGI
jgi:mannosyltransferase